MTQGAELHICSEQSVGKKNLLVLKSNNVQLGKFEISNAFSDSDLNSVTSLIRMAYKKGYADIRTHVNKLGQPDILSEFVKLKNKH